VVIIDKNNNNDNSFDCYKKKLFSIYEASIALNKERKSWY
jgi:hypothetical protein